MLKVFQDIYQRYAARKMFSSWSPTYEIDVAINSYSAADKVAEAAIRHLATLDTANPHIADIGIGTGLLAQQVYDAMPCEITGIDFTEDMMAVCLQREITELLIKLDAGKDPWPLPPQSYDAVISAGLFEYFTPSMVQHFLKESAQCLKAGGLMIFSYVPSPISKNTIKLWHGRSGDFLSCEHNADKLVAAIEEKNFKILEHSDVFKGSVFRDGSTYSYRLIAAQKI